MGGVSYLFVICALQIIFLNCEGRPKIDRQEGIPVDDTFRPLPFPVNFGFYDLNRDGYVNMKELQEATGEADNLQQAFSASDLNNDGWVSRREYEKVPWGYNRRRDAVLKK